MLQVKLIMINFFFDYLSQIERHDVCNKNNDNDDNDNDQLV